MTPTPFLIPTQESDAAIWTTQLGERIPVKQMKTPHLFNTVRMLYNHNVPTPFQVFHRNRYKFKMSKPAQCAWVLVLLEELSTRSDLSEIMIKLLAEMQQNARKLSQKRLS